MEFTVLLWRLGICCCISQAWPWSSQMRVLRVRVSYTDGAGMRLAIPIFLSHDHLQIFKRSGMETLLSQPRHHVFSNVFWSVYCTSRGTQMLFFFLICVLVQCIDTHFETRRSQFLNSVKNNPILTSTTKYRLNCLYY